MQGISVYFISVLLWVLLGLPPCRAQQQDSVQQKKTMAYEGGLLPSALRIGPSLNNVVNTLIDPESTYWGFQADLPIRQFMLSFDYGQAKIHRENTDTEQPDRNFQYESKGSFFRVGIDANLLKDRKTESNDARGDVIYFGLRYAHSRIDDQLIFKTRQDLIYSVTTITQSNNNLGVWWLEMNAGVKVEISNNIFLGYALRYKFFRRFDDKSSLLPYEIPGFGKGKSENAFGFDYYIFYYIPFKK